MRIFSCLFAIVLNFHIGVSSRAAEHTQTTGEAAFDKAVKAFNEHRFADAADGFRLAYRLRPSWKLLFNMGQAESAAKRYGLALDFFERYLAQGGDDVPIQRQNSVRNEIERLRIMVGFLKIAAPKDAIVIINGVERGKAPLNSEIPVTASVDLKIETMVDGELVAEQTVKVSGGRTVAVDMVPQKSDKSTHRPFSAPPVEIGSSTTSSPISLPDHQTDAQWTPLKLWGWIWMGVGGACILGGGIVGGIALAKDRELKRDCEETGCYSSEYDAMDRRTVLATSSTVLFAAGGVLAATGLILAIVDRKGKSKDRRVTMLPGQGGLVIEGRF